MYGKLLKLTLSSGKNNFPIIVLKLFQSACVKNIIFGEINFYWNQLLYYNMFLSCIRFF